MSYTVTMPQLGETVTEGTILRWVKQAGDSITEDEILLEISTDKVDTEVPSPATGTILEVLVAEGETVDVGTALAVIGDAGEQVVAAAAATAPEPIAEPAPAAAPPTPEPAPEPVASPPPVAPVAAPAAAPVAPTASAVVGNLSPVVRKLASEHGVDLSQVVGSGQGGRITRRDVEAFVASGASAVAATAAVDVTPVAPTPEPEVVEAPVVGAPVVEAPPVVAEPAPTAVPTAPAVAAAAPAAQEPPSEPAPTPAAAASVPAAAGDEVIPLDRLRVRIAENMIRAKQTAAHVWTSVEVDYEHVEQVRQRHKTEFKEREGFSLTYLPFITRATIDALNAYPVVNSSFYLEEKTRVQHASVNMGIAVDLDQGGLIVMTIPGADGLRMRGIARDVRRLATKARDGKIEPDDVSGSTFTITNPGPFGSFMSAPVINVPNVAILSTDTVAKRAVVVTDDDGHDAIAIRHVGYLGLTWDHRAFDGSTAVLFLRRIKENLETWDWEQELA